MPSIDTSRTGLLRCLDVEALLEIFEILRLEDALRPLSLTCKWLRELCKHTLFGECSVYSYTVDKSENPVFLPRSLWPYVRVLNFSGAFARPDLVRLSEDYFGPFRYEEWLQEPARRFAAAEKLGLFVKEALLSMPNLHTICFDISRSVNYRGIEPRAGVAAHVLEAFLSIPRLRHLSVCGRMCNPEDQHVFRIALPPRISVETLDYTVSLFREPPRTSEVDKHALLLLLERAHDTLASLTIPSESAPLHRMHSWQWPRLRKLRLYGERPTYQGALPLVMTLGRMPRLRDLSLFFAEPAGTEHQVSWPPNVRASYGWYELERLEVTHPHPEDELYAHLPVSLRHLILRCWPRYYKHHCALRKDMDEARVRWASPLLSSSEMLRLLRKSDTPNLTHLELEFRADAASYGDIFRYIGSSYSRLKVLQAHCYRNEGSADLSVKHIAHALRGLVDLRLLMLHLDFRCLPDVKVIDMWYSQFEEEQIQGEQMHQTAVDAAESAANVFAKTLAPSLEYVCILVPVCGTLQQWCTYRVVRSPDGSTVEEYDPPGWPRALYGYDIDTDD